jgi:UDP-N-acetyl-D-mannosaminuronic acid dehydrogenase
MKNEKPSVVMMGLGYIGLPTAALIASKGLQVTGVDIREEVVDTINKGEIHIVEPDLDGLVHHAVKKGLLKASMIAEEADVFLIAVPTPFKGEYKPDISFVEKAIDAIIPVLKEENLIIIESTSPVGTTEKMLQFILDKRPDLEGKLYMAYCPERVLPGNIMHELEKNDRAIGGINEESTQKSINFYKYFVKGELHKTNARTAEMCKLVENASRDGQIAFANELSMICDKAGIDVWELIRLANKHPRVNILQPGTGVGGHCIAVDPWFIVSEFPEESNLIRKARDVNTFKTQWVIEKIKNKALAFEIENKRKPIIACMGLAFKPNIDDLRESPAVTVVEALEKEGLPLLKVEPNLKNWKEEGLTNCDDAVNDADILVFLVAHSEFYSIKTDKIVLDFNGIRNV